MAEVRIVPDICKNIALAVNDLRIKYDFVFTTGGIGSTHDDITALSIANAFGVDLVINDEAMNIVNFLFHLNPPKSAKKMAMMPEGHKLIPRNSDEIPSFYIENVYVLAGMPQIMQLMFLSVEKIIGKSKPFYSKDITLEVSEINIAHRLAQIQEKFQNISIGSYPMYENNKSFVRLVARGKDIDTVNCAIKAIEQDIKKLS